MHISAVCTDPMTMSPSLAKLRRPRLGVQPGGKEIQDQSRQAVRSLLPLTEGAPVPHLVSTFQPPSNTMDCVISLNATTPMKCRRGGRAGGGGRETQVHSFHKREVRGRGNYSEYAARWGYRRHTHATRKAVIRDQSDHRSK